MVQRFESPKTVLLGATLVFLLASRVVIAQAPSQDSTIVVKLKVLKQVGPVQILGVRLPEEAGKEPSVHLRNASSHRTKAIWTEAIITNGRGQVSRTNSNVPNLRWPAERSIAPGAESWARETVLASHSLMIAGKGLHSNCLTVDVVIMAVDFDDGTSWHLDVGNDGLAGAILPEHIDETVTCSSATATQSEVDKLVGASVNLGLLSGRRPPSGEVQSFSFLCSLKSKFERTVASCPF